MPPLGTNKRKPKEAVGVPNTRIAPCPGCRPNPYQDTAYGGQRVQNRMKPPVLGAPQLWRCTVCSKVQS